MHRGVAEQQKAPPRTGPELSMWTALVRGQHYVSALVRGHANHKPIRTANPMDLHAGR